MEEVQHAIRQVNEEYVSIRTKREQFSDMLNNADLRREDILEKIDTLLKELDDLKPRAQQAMHDLEEQENKLSIITENLSANSELLSQKSAAYNEQNIFYHQQENRVKSIEQESRFKQESMDQSSQRIEVNAEELRKNEDEVKKIIETTQSNDDELIGMYAEKEEMEKGLSEAEKEYYESRGNIDHVEKQFREVQHQRQNIDTLLMELQNQLNESKMHLNSVKERLSVEFNIDLGHGGWRSYSGRIRTACSALTKKRSAVTFKRCATAWITWGLSTLWLWKRIPRSNNAMILLSLKKRILLKAKESLFNTIAEIEAVASTTFMEAFNKIKEHFIRVFRSLFTEGDECDLRLVDPNNPLESDIDIIAKPKGKRPLTINQLSGGEKTLTATALLFSMYLLKPAPFCIFDEVDAPLDDANIDKFNNIIRNFSKDSQFVIVTHNKRTMTSTDVIYGITMVEKGISRVVPVDLRELA